MLSKGGQLLPLHHWLRFCLYSPGCCCRPLLPGPAAGSTPSPLLTKPQGHFPMSCPPARQSPACVTAKGSLHPGVEIASCPCWVSQGSCRPIPAVGWDVSKWPHCPQLYCLVPPVRCHLETWQVHSVASSRSLVKMLNRTGSRTGRLLYTTHYCSAGRVQCINHYLERLDSIGPPLSMKTSRGSFHPRVFCDSSQIQQNPWCNRLAFLA